MTRPGRAAKKPKVRLVARDKRLSGKAAGDDARTPFQIDRDRILYSMPFRRLAGVTQVVSPGQGEIFHNRLTHSLKVAQIARRFAENLPRHYGEQIEAWGGADADVVEAAALAHDLGHPPFGHIAEETLDDLISEELNDVHKNNPAIPYEGYEGNAQSFRILTELAIRRGKGGHGLDLAAATLNAALKYPWKWRQNATKAKKYGAYGCDEKAFSFARSCLSPKTADPFERSLEAQIMDWSDDIAYSVHDTEDFYRAGLIPLDRLAADASERANYQRSVVLYATRNGMEVSPRFLTVFNDTFDSISIREPYTGTPQQQRLLADFVSTSINDFVTNTSVLEPPGEAGEAISVPEEIRLRVFFLKRLVWTYVIENPALSAHQLGQQRAIETLFREFNTAAKAGKWHLFPAFFHERAMALKEDGAGPPVDLHEARTRLVADTIASMTDRQALLMYQQFSGISVGSMIDPVVR